MTCPFPINKVYSVTSKHAKPSFVKTTILSTFLDLLIIALSPALFKLISYEVIQDNMNIVQSLVYILGISKISKTFHHSNRKNICQVRFLPFGVQLEEFHSQKHTTKKQQLSIHNCSKVQFIPREQIIDVVVVEMVLSYKVYSMVAFRVNQENDSITNVEPRKTYKQRRKEASLIPAFDPSLVEMTYDECMSLWSTMKNDFDDAYSTNS